MTSKYTYFLLQFYLFINNKYMDFNLSVYNIISVLRQLTGDLKILS